MLRTLLPAQYIKCVLGTGLAGRLHPIEGQRLLSKVRKVALGKKPGSFEEIARINAFLLWHLAFARKAPDRAACLAIAEQFENSVLRQITQFGEDALFYPVPFSPAFSLYDLQNPRPGQTLSTRGHVPNYRRLQVDPTLIRQPDYALAQIKLALGARGRRIISDNGTDKLSSIPLNNYTVQTNPKHPSEQTCIFKAISAHEAGICLFFLINGWPVGYGGAFSEDPQDTIVGINFHMFHEYRGTPCSYAFFLELQRQTVNFFKNADLLAVKFSSLPAFTVPLFTRQPPFVSFLRRDGFHAIDFLSPNALYKQTR
ncbi:MAG: hypothetical protein WC901_02975 [Candidatus Margulisiibacteriota bacterium]